MSSIQSILLILCIVAIVAYIVGLLDGGRYGRPEGFAAPVSPVQGRLPEALQSSMIPRDSASATTANPQLAKPDYRDWTDARDSFGYFLEIYTPSAAEQSGKSNDIAAMLLEVPKYIAQIEQFILKPEAVPSRDLLERGVEARELADSMRRVGPAEPYGVGWERPGPVSCNDDNLMAA